MPAEHNFLVDMVCAEVSSSPALVELQAIVFGDGEVCTLFFPHSSGSRICNLRISLSSLLSGLSSCVNREGEGC